jgi:hypothetical protein
MQMLEMLSESEGFGLCAKLHLNAFSSMATRRNFGDWDIMELALELVCDARLLEDSSSAESDSGIV